MNIKNNIPILVTDTVAKQENQIIKNPNNDEYVNILEGFKSHLSLIPDTLTELYTIKQQSDYDAQLGWFRKYNPWMKDTDPSFDNSLLFKTKTLSLGLTFASNIIAATIDYGLIEKFTYWIKIKRIFESLVENVVYIQGEELTKFQQLKLRRLMQESGLAPSEKDILNMIEKSLQKNDYSPLNNNFFANHDFRVHYTTMLLKILDLDNITFKDSTNGKKLFEYSTGYLAFTENEYHAILSNSIVNTEILNRMRDLTHFSMQEFIGNIKGVNIDSEHIHSLIENDPYRERRNKYKENTKKFATTFGKATLAAVSTGGTAGIIAGGGILLKDMLGENNSKKEKEILNAFNEEIPYQMKKVKHS